MLDETLCPVARSTAIVGDRWALVILRELFAGSTRFDELEVQTGATPQMLATRLKRLEADGMIERHVYSRRPLRHEYRLTKMGRDFYPVVLALRAWGETWCKEPGEPLAIETTHRACGSNVDLHGRCEACNVQVSPSELQAKPSAAYAEERRRRGETARP